MSDKDLNERNIEKACRELARQRLDKELWDGVTQRKINFILSEASIRPDMRPHTWCFLRDQRGESVCLGVVFHTWPKHRSHLRFETNHDDGSKTIETAEFKECVIQGKSIEERGLMLPKPWCFYHLMSKFTGLTAGNL